jgi:glycosyltransferase involved in cell wall biosynthesis
VLVPTAAEDPVIRFSMLDHLSALPAAYLFLTPEEETLVALHCSRPLPPSCIVGMRLDPFRSAPGMPLEAIGITRPFVLYLGRIDPNKGCETLLRYFLRRQAASGSRVPLVMAGPANMPIPGHASVKQLGLVDEPAREALLAHATVLVVPSPYESLSMVLLEAWNHGVPGLVNGRCSVLKGQALRADGALYYQNFDEFARVLDYYLLGRPDTARQIGQQGLSYVDREYRWPQVIHKIEQLLASIERRAATG